MADNVAITAGSGTSIAADDISSVFYQRVKLALGADGSATDALGGAGTVSAGVQRVTLATDDRVSRAVAGDYETVAASQTTQALGATGATGDFISHLVVIPATTSPGAVAIKDGSGTAITVFAGGADSVTTLIPFVIPLNMISGAGAWQVTTGSNVSVIAVGDFN